jgi:thiol-disulfide isomerase/thioredoxin
MKKNASSQSASRWKPIYYIAGAVLTFFFLNEVARFIQDDRPELLRKHGIVPFDQPVPISHYSFRDLENNNHSFSDYKGEYSILMFWATWCGYCAREYPQMDAFYAKAKEKINIIPIAHTEDFPDAIRAFYAKLGVKHLPAFWVYGVGLHRHMQIKGYPSFFIMDKEARVVAQARPDWQSGDLLDALEMLKEQHLTPITSQ